MAKRTTPEPGSLIDRLNRRREQVAAEAHGDQTDEQQLASEELGEMDVADGEEALSDHELLEKYELPDPETVEDEAGLDRFFEGDMPERLRRLALRRVWRLNPLFRFADEMVEYGEDYTDAATVVEGMQTAYQVGKGYLTKAKEAIEGEPLDSASEVATSDDGKTGLDAEKNENPEGEIGESDHSEDPDDEEVEAHPDPLSDQKDAKVEATEVIADESGAPNQQNYDHPLCEVSRTGSQGDGYVDLNNLKNDTSNHEKNQFGTVLEEKRNQLVRPKRMVFKKPAQ